VTVANGYLSTINSQGYRLPFAGGTGGAYYWGDNSDVANNGIILALAYDFTGSSQYLNGANEAMNYLLGRNAMNKSYVTGYGENPLLNPHHRFWAKQANASFPAPPPGALSGGPNSGLEDPYASANLGGCKPQKCFVDHYESYSTNEITINWNAPLAWLAAYLDEKGGGVITPTVTPAITNTPTRTNTPVPATLTPTRTNTLVGPTATFTRTATRTNTPTGPTATFTRTATRTNTPVGPTATRTSTPVPPTNTPAVPTATPTSGGGSTCTPTSTITAPFTYDGAGTFCWQSSSLGGYINSWNTNSVTINGVNITNLYMASGSYPAKIGGFWYVAYNASFAWSHFEAK
jgi:endoglucanase